MTVLLAVVMVAALGVWIPLAQLLPGISEGSRVFYVAVGNVVFAGIALIFSGADLGFGWRTFWLPLAGGMVWTAGNYCVFKASNTMGLARAAGTWTPLNIVIAFGWGAVLFGELDGFSAVRFTLLGVGFLAVVAGVVFIASSRNTSEPTSSRRLASGRDAGRQSTMAAVPLLWAAAAGVLWGSYFVPAQWAGVPAQASNFPLALGILVGSLVLTLPKAEPAKLGLRATSTLLAAGVLFGIGNLALLAVVARLGTGTGFTIAQLSLAVNAGIGIYVFRTPQPGTRQARKVLVGILIAGVGGCVIAALR